jgi:hypothetical protein
VIPNGWNSQRSPLEPALACLSEAANGPPHREAPGRDVPGWQAYQISGRMPPDLAESAILRSRTPRYAAGGRASARISR